ncbi:MAG: nucleotidyltransferase family protein [Paracoccaceae bacterium]
MAPCLVILLLAAGSSSRMRGRDKLMEVVEGQPLIRRALERALGTGLPVMVTLPAPDHPRARAVGNDLADLVYVPDAAEGMSASIRRGIEALPPDTGGVMILPADLPDLNSKDLLRMASTWVKSPDMILRATSANGDPGHPVIFPYGYFGDLAAVTGDRGARMVLSDHARRVRHLPLAGNRATTDLDTPEAWAAWRTAQDAP